MSTLLTDLPAREVVRDGLDENLFVEASAGTGKTTELVERVVALYRSGAVDAGRLAAITFTEAAAAELRHRVRSRLEAEVAGGDPGGRLAAALAAMDDAAFTTLHGFAQRLLSEHPLEAGLPPQIEVIADADEVLEFDRRWEGFLNALAEDDRAASLLRRAADLGLKLSALRAFAEELQDDVERFISDAPEELPRPDAQPLIETLDAVLALRGSCRARTDRLLQHLEGSVAALRSSLAEVSASQDVVRCLATAPTLRSTLGEAKRWDGCKPEVVKLLGEAQELLEAQLLRQRDAVARTLAGRVSGFLREWARLRRRSGRLRYHDLLVLAARLLRERAGVRAALRERYTALLLDEFQDTDPLQVEIAALLASADPLDGRVGWTVLRPDPGRLFLVGDPKQSIYRFRRADITVYERARRTLGLRDVTLTQNFRCVPGIVDWVNAAFTAILGVGVEDAQPAYSPLVAERHAVPLPPGGRTAVRHFGEPSPDRVGRVREREAGDVALAVQRILDEGWQVADPVTGSLRPARARDIAILVRRHATVRLLERALSDVPLPYRIESKSLIYATDEVRDLVTLLQAIDDPTDEVAVVAALRHPALGCDDRALLEWRAADGRWDHRAPPPAELPPHHPVAGGMRRLRTLHEQRWSLPVGTFVEHVIAELRLLELACGTSRPRDRWRRLRFLTDQAHAFHDSGGHLRGFLRWVTQQAEQDVRVDEFLADEPDDDAVRITTVHGAKGLEYPIVILLGLDRDTRRLPANPRLLFAPDGTPQLSLGGGLCTAGWADLRRHEVTMHAHEGLRLLYVGTTRARDHLLLSLHHHTRTPCHAATLLDVPGLEPHWSPLDLDQPGPGPAGSALAEPARGPAGSAPDVAKPSPTAAGAGLDLHQTAPAAAARGSARTSGPVQLPLALVPEPGVRARTHADLQRWQAERARLADRATTLAVRTVGPAPDPLDETASRKGRAATPLGRALHGTLQTVPLPLDPGLDLHAIALAQATVEGIPDAAAEITHLARRALAEVPLQLAATRRHWRQLPIAGPADGITVEGTLDLVYEADDGHSLIALAYQTEEASPTRRHQHDLATLARALRTVTGRPVIRCILLSPLATPSTSEFPLPPAEPSP